MNNSPLWHIDAPILDHREGDEVRCAGWALDGFGRQFSAVTLITGKTSQPAEIGIERNDVVAAYPGLVLDKLSGFDLAVRFKAGDYVSRLVAFTDNGDQFVLSEFAFTVRPAMPVIRLETPSEKRLQTGKIRFSGWCFHNPSKVVDIAISIDGQKYPCAYGLERPDVAEAHPGQPNALNSGFEVSVPLPPGTPSISAHVLLDDGSEIHQQISLGLVVKPVPLWVLAKRRIGVAARFTAFAYTKAREWYRVRGRLPRLSEIPHLAAKTTYYFRKVSRGDLQLEQLPVGFVPPPREDLYGSWVRYNEWNERRRRSCTERLAAIPNAPLISILMPVFNPPVEFLEIAIASVSAQVYDNWELCIADDCSTSQSVRDFIAQAASKEPRIKYVFLPANGNISASTNAAAKLASGSYFAFLDQDDELTPDALFEVVAHIGDYPATDFLYSDDDKIDDSGNRFAPQFKPDWSPELLLSYMYFSHLIVVSKSLFDAVGGMRIGFEGSQDYDFALRATERASRIGHIPKILYHWRVLPGSTAQSGHAKPASIGAGLRAVQDALVRRQIMAHAVQPEWARRDGLGIFSLEFPDEGPSVSIIVPTRNSLGVLKTCLDSLRKTTYKNFEVIVVDNESDDSATIDFLSRCGLRVLSISNPPGGFNYSYINNRAVEMATAEYVLFLNNDTEVLNPRWLSQMMGYAKIGGVGAVGARLLYPDERIQHAGIVHGYYKGMAGPAHKLLPKWHHGYLSYTVVARNYLAVTAACLLINRQRFLSLGGFNESNFAVAYNDVDLCYRLADLGFRCVYCPDAELTHFEGHSRGFDDKPGEEAWFRQLHGRRVDPYYNPNLSLDSELFEVFPRAAELRSPSQPIRALMIAFNLNLEGAPYSQYELTCGLKRLGIIDPVVYCPQDGPLRDLYQRSGIEVLVRPHPLRGVFSIEQYQNAIDEFVRSIQELAVEVVYGNTLQTFYAIDAAARAGIPSIWNPRESEPWQDYFSHFGDDIARQALSCFALPYRIVFVSDATRRGFEALNSTNNFVMIHNGLDPERAKAECLEHPRSASRDALGIQPHELVVLLLGTVCARKGQIDLVQAVKKLADSESTKRLRFFIVGDRKSSYSTQMHSELAGLPDDLRLRVTVVDETRQTALYLSAADIFICASRVESYPRVILEAMYYGLAIITTPVFGITEQVIDKSSALYYPPGDAIQLAAHLQSLAEDADLRIRLSKNARQRLTRLTGFDEMLNQYGRCFIEAYYTGGGYPVQRVLASPVGSFELEAPKEIH